MNTKIIIPIENTESFQLQLQQLKELFKSEGLILEGGNFWLYIFDPKNINKGKNFAICTLTIRTDNTEIKKIFLNYEDDKDFESMRRIASKIAGSLNLKEIELRKLSLGWDIYLKNQKLYETSFEGYW